MKELEQAANEYFGSYLIGVYTCSRVWEAWSSNTMTQDDFQEAKEDDEFFDDFIKGVLNFADQQLRLKVDEMKASQQENEIILLDRIKELEKWNEIDCKMYEDRLQQLKNPLDVKIDEEGDWLREPDPTFFRDTQHFADYCDKYQQAQTVSERLQSDKEKIEHLKGGQELMQINIENKNRKLDDLTKSRDEHKEYFYREREKTEQLQAKVKELEEENSNLKLSCQGGTEYIEGLKLQKTKLYKQLTQSKAEVERLREGLKTLWRIGKCKMTDSNASELAKVRGLMNS